MLMYVQPWRIRPVFAIASAAADFFLVHGAGETVPTVPPHRGCETYPIPNFDNQRLGVFAVCIAGGEFHLVFTLLGDGAGVRPVLRVQRQSIRQSLGRVGDRLIAGGRYGEQEGPTRSGAEHSALDLDARYRPGGLGVRISVVSAHTVALSNRPSRAVIQCILIDGILLLGSSWDYSMAWASGGPLTRPRSPN